MAEQERKRLKKLPARTGQPPDQVPVTGTTKPTHPAVADILQGLAVQQAVPTELMPAISEMLTYIYQMDDVAEKRKQIQRR
ncbi:hypothetical protein D3C87_1744310 [compost metagenome]